MGMMLDDHEQKLFYKLVREELKSYGFDDDGNRVMGGPIRPSEVAYVKLLLSALERTKKSVKREHARKKRIQATIERIEQKRLEEPEDDHG